MRFTLLTVGFLLFSIPSFGQEMVSTDSLTFATRWQAKEDSLVLFYRKGKLKKCVELAKETLAWTETQVDSNNIYFIKSINNLGSTLNWTGENEKAIIYLEKSKSLLEKSEKTESSEYCNVINDLGMTFRSMGLFHKALPLLKDNAPRYKHLFGPESYELSVSLNNLALVYQSIRDYQSAIATMKAAIEVTEKSVGKKHRRYAVRVGALASIYAIIGDYHRGIEILESVLPTIIEHQGKEHPAYTSAARNLASAYSRVNRYEEARILIDDVLLQAEKVYGKKHRAYGIYLHTSAQFYLLEGKYSTALETIDASLKVDKLVYGKNSRGYLGSSRTRSFILEKMGAFDQLVQNNSKILEISKWMANNQFPFFSEKEQEKLLIQLNDNFDLVQTINYKYPKLEPLGGLGFDQSLLMKNILRDNHQNLLAQIKQSGNTVIQQKATEWNQLKTTLSQQYGLRKSRRLPKLDSLEDRANDLERELALTTFKFKHNKEFTNWKAIQARLKKGEVAIEFCHFNYTLKLKPSDSTFYLAYVLTADAPPKMIRLFEEKEMGNIKATRNLYTPQPKGQSPSLKKLIWEPLSAHLEGKEKIYYSPSGLLHRINFGAIPINENLTISENFQLEELGSSSQIIDLKNKLNEEIHSAILYGSIQYGLEEVLSQESTIQSESELKEKPEIGQRGGAWDALVYTKKEVKAIEEILANKGATTITLSGLAASEEHFKQLSNKEKTPDLIHLATHGYFFSKPKENAKLGIKTSEHPLIRSGLVLAGANKVWQEQNALSPNEEDGILTAYEIAQMDLSNTKLVVLSACETGLGDIEGSEGVYGLQRAFKIAGVDCLLMSLWSVDDKKTYEFMTAFYDFWQNQGKSIPAAYQATQNILKKKYAKPFNPSAWAGFVLLQ